MLRRRILEHVRTQHWSAIAIDFAIVVFGVFFGNQVSNWNESRHEAHRTQAFLVRIQSDLSADSAALERRKIFWRQVSVYGYGAIRYAETGERVDGSAWQTLLAFYQASQLFPYVPLDTTYQELRSAGELGLIDRRGLRAALADYYVNGSGYAANFLFRFEPEYRKLVRGLTPTVASAQVWAHCHKSFDGDTDQALVPCDSPMSEADAQAVLNAYRADPRLLRELRFWITNLDVMTTLIEHHQESAGRLAKRLHEESGQ